MDQSQDINLEELFWRSPQHVQMMGGYLHSNNILFYFAESPFFDATSNNASLAIQASYNEAFRHFLETREVFEGRLKTMQGLEFMVTYDPLQDAAQSDTEFAHTPSNIWVIRKQLRQKRPGKEDDVVILSTYYVVGDAVYMAPAVSSVVGNRILSAVTSLTKLLTVASPLPIFTPSYGHVYMPPGPKAVDAPQTTSQLSQQSKEITPVPDSQGSAKTSLTTTSTTTNVKDTSYQDTRNLMEAMNLLSRYGDEFMDETPLSGDPGSFILSKANETTTGGRRMAKTTTNTTTTTILRNLDLTNLQVSPATFHINPYSIASTNQITNMTVTTGQQNKPAVVCVFCGSVGGQNPAHIEAAVALARAFHEQNVHLVYGGGTHGLMGAVAKELVRLSGPEAVHGIIPKALVKFNEDKPQQVQEEKVQEGAGKAHERTVQTDKRTELNETEYGLTTIVPDMHTRKRLMATKVLEGGPGSGFVSLAGGFGTIEEVMEMTTWNQLGIHKVGIVLLNIDGYWDGVLAWIQNAVKEGFISQADGDILVQVQDVKDVLPKLREYTASADRFQLTWGEE
ncbi:hypothetical protein PISL3812_05870 [Talaromyces islandicus]|uniref:Mediator of RNA polymerase II transcription subunit 6 n=1 Tax=Talaromyces islandicus TaxID=28573 RepID=A0A0U1LZV6_TALIS|nr:hypothetical protein PISL3812_05870 [Talaromyces islandicus]